MNRFFGSALAVAALFAATGAATANGRPSHHNDRGSSHHGDRGTSSRHVSSYHGQHGHRWGHTYWNGRYGCYNYWCPSTNCYYYWCQPAGCYYPVTYCPYNTYNFGVPSNYAPSVPVATAPVAGSATATATATATVGGSGPVSGPGPGPGQ